MLNKLLVFTIVLLSSSITYSNAAEKEGVVIKIVSEVNENMLEMKFDLENDFSKEELNNWIESSKKIQIIKEVKLTNKKSPKELTWVFNQAPTLRDFKVIFAMLNIQQVEMNGKVMSAVEFTTFGFSSNNSKSK